MSARIGRLVEILLPLANNDGAPIPDGLLAAVLVGHFGGLTAFTRSPEEGLWVSDLVGELACAGLAAAATG